jgi:hypothetical protein
VGFRFRRSLWIAPGFRLNIGKRGISTSIGGRGAHVTIGHSQVRETVGLPGTGLSYTHIDGARKTHQEARGQAPAAPVTEQLPKGVAWRGWLWLMLLFGLLAFLAQHMV